MPHSLNPTLNPTLSQPVSVLQPAPGDAQPMALPPLQQSITVTFNYQVHFTLGLFELDNPLLANVLAQEQPQEPKSLVVVLDAGLLSSYTNLPQQIIAYAQHYQTALNLKAEPLLVAGGEAAKNDPAYVLQVQRLIEQAGLCRHSYVVVVGGGAVLDMVGYAAATAHRGIRLVRVPTTVLAQDDSGVGVKNSVNAFGKKNFLGTFATPFAVINDAAFLTALEQRDWIGGVAEAIKVALIKDADLFDWIEAHADALVERDMAVMQQVIYQSCQHHLRHIGTYGDPFEMGSSRPLDFGHWAAHRLEHLSHYHLRHGEAVAIGMALDSTYAYLAGCLPAQDWQRILNLLQRLGFELSVPELSAFADDPHHALSVFRGLNEFREHLGGELTLMLLSAIGQGVEVHHVDLELYQQAIQQLVTDSAAYLPNSSCYANLSSPRSASTAPHLLHEYSSRGVLGGGADQPQNLSA